VTQDEYPRRQLSFGQSSSEVLAIAILLGAPRVLGLGVGAEGVGVGAEGVGTISASSLTTTNGKPGTSPYLSFMRAPFR